MHCTTAPETDPAEVSEGVEVLRSCEIGSTKALIVDLHWFSCHHITSYWATTQNFAHPHMVQPLFFCSFSYIGGEQPREGALYKMK